MSSCRRAELDSLWQQRAEPLSLLLSFPGAVLLAFVLVLLPDRVVFWIVLQPITEGLTGLPVQRLVGKTDGQRHQSRQVVVLQLYTPDGKTQEKQSDNYSGLD